MKNLMSIFIFSLLLGGCAFTEFKSVSPEELDRRAAEVDRVIGICEDASKGNDKQFYACFEQNYKEVK